MEEVVVSRADIESVAVGNQACMLVRDRGRAVVRGACNWVVWDRYSRAVRAVLSDEVVVIMMVTEHMSVGGCCMMTRGTVVFAARANDMAAWEKQPSFQEV